MHAHGAGPRDPLRLVFGLHLHQPVGNFDHVFENHARDVYRPLVRQLERRRLRPVLLHMSGPLLEWLEAHDAPLLDDLGRLVSDGAVELLLGGMYEPILIAIPRADRAEQIGWHRERIRARFGAEARGLWLTERVWEPELAADLADAGVEYVLVDDRHFLVTGFQREQLHAPFRTESDGRALSVLAIDERLRYLIPFHAPHEIATFLREAHAAAMPLAVYADDGEKFGGWPGTRALVYDRGWFDMFCDVIDTLTDEGVVRLTGGHEAIQAVPAQGLAYLPTAAYQEMETWALPPDAARRIAAIESDLGSERMAGPDRALVRGSHWRNFLVRYTEANRLHKKMSALSALARRRGAGMDVRRAVGRSQCNDAYWHGVFGGLYLPHLRAALWRELAVAERLLRAGEQIGAELTDFDYDGADEIWVHGASFSAIVAPARGGSVVEFTHFASGVNVADTLTRRLEAYHMPALGTPPADDRTEGVPSIHEIEASVGLDTLPPVDLDDRALGVARLIAGDVSPDDYAAARYTPLESWARARCIAHIDASPGRVEVRCEAPGFSAAWRFSADGLAEVEYRWDPSRCADGSRFAPEFSLSVPIELSAPGAVDVWRYPIETVAKSERGIERVVQGEAVTPLFDARAGVARISLGPV